MNEIALNALASKIIRIANAMPVVLSIVKRTIYFFFVRRVDSHEHVLNALLNIFISVR